jgi:hypothetical protein
LFKAGLEKRIMAEIDDAADEETVELKATMGVQRLLDAAQLSEEFAVLGEKDLEKMKKSLQSEGSSRSEGPHLWETLFGVLNATASQRYSVDATYVNHVADPETYLVSGK